MKKLMHWGATVTLLLCAALAADKKLMYRDADVAGEWFGISESGMYSARLVLRTNGTGMLALRYLDREVRTYSVQKWQVHGREVVLEIIPDSANATLFKPSVEIRSGIRLDMLMSDSAKRPKWRVRTTLWKEAWFLRHRDELVRSMEMSKQEPYSAK